MNLLIVDNNDSFTYNLVQIIEESALVQYDVLAHNQIHINKVDEYDKILFSPGPALPEDFPVMKEILKTYETKKSILGICLGLQAIAKHYGCNLINLDEVVHGKRRINHILKEDTLFEGVEQSFNVGLYHSWALSEEGFPECLEITSKSESGIIMSVRHKHYDVRGLQFHPESIITEIGEQIIINWLKN